MDARNYQLQHWGVKMVGCIIFQPLPTEQYKSSGFTEFSGYKLYLCSEGGYRLNLFIAYLLINRSFRVFVKWKRGLICVERFCYVWTGFIQNVTKYFFISESFIFISISVLIIVSKFGNRLSPITKKSLNRTAQKLKTIVPLPTYSSLSDME